MDIRSLYHFIASEDIHQSLGSGDSYKRLQQPVCNSNHWLHRDICEAMPFTPHLRLCCYCCEIVDSHS